jgi:maltose O-acetyltransferase
MNGRLLARVGYELFAKHLPDSCFPLIGPSCRAIRHWFVRRLALVCGERVNLERGASVGFGAGIQVGSYSGFGMNCYIEGPLIMGQNVLMAPDVVILRQNRHSYERTDISMREQEDVGPRPLTICDDVWLGRRAIILPGCLRVGKGAIVGAAAVVTKDVPNYAIVAGNPARVVRMRKLTHNPEGESTLTLPKTDGEIVYG